jgi:hypothetical protein
VKRRWRKKVPAADRQPLVRPQWPNEVWSPDFVFDRTAEGRVLKSLIIVDDSSTEAVAAVPARALGGLAVTRILDRLAISIRSATQSGGTSPGGRDRRGRWRVRPAACTGYKQLGLRRQASIYFVNPLVHDFYVAAKASGVDGFHKSREVIAGGSQVSLGTVVD